MKKSILTFSIYKDFGNWKKVYVLLLFVLINSVIVLASKYLFKPGNFYSEIKSFSLLSSLGIIFFSSLKSFQFINSGMDKQALASVRSKAVVFWHIVIYHFFIVLFFTLLTTPAFVFSLVTFSPDQLIPTSSSFGTADFLLSYFLLALYTTALTLPFIFYFKTSVRFILGIYFIPQFVMSFSLIARRIGKIRYAQYLPFDLGELILNHNIDLKVLLFMMIYSSVFIAMAKKIY